MARVRDTTTAREGRLSEAEVVLWLKRGLLRRGLGGRAVREVLVDADQSYLRSPFRRQLEPTDRVVIGDWRPDLVCVVEGDGAERIAGFEVKAASEHEKGLLQANRYREGVHEEYLCIPATGARAPDWIIRGAADNRVGLVRATATGLLLDIPAPRPQPDPRALQVTRRYLLGEVGLRALGLNRPLHYAAALYAFAFTDEPVLALEQEWGLGASETAVRGAQTLGLLNGSSVTYEGKAFADTLRFMGFTLADCRVLTAPSRRLAADAPNLAAVMRSILLRHSAVELIVQVLDRAPPKQLTAQQLATKAMLADEGLARAVFGEPPERDEPWHIKSTTRYQLKAALYDMGIIDSRLAKGANTAQDGGEYDPKADLWALGTACQPTTRFV